MKYSVKQIQSASFNQLLKMTSVQEGWLPTSIENARNNLQAAEYFDEVKTLIRTWADTSRVRNKTGARWNAVRNLVKNVNWEKGVVTFTTTVVLTSKLTNSKRTLDLVAGGDFEQAAFAKADEKVLQKMFVEKFKRHMIMTFEFFCKHFL